MKREFWEHKNILITGGTSGLGRALALHLNEAGAKVAVIARTRQAINDLVRTYPRIIGIQGDVSSKEAIYPIAGEVHTRLGDVDVLFNVASYLGKSPLRMLMDTDCEDFEKVLQTNLVGPFRLTKAILPSMLLKQQGVVVNISSDAAVTPYAGWGAYGSSKAAVDQLTAIFQEELGELGVRFFAVDPGDMNTPMHFAAVPNADPTQLRDPRDSARRLLELVETGDQGMVRRSV